jgi:hypothetical protein
VIGAALLLVGLALVGSGYLTETSIENEEFHCILSGDQCGAQSRTLTNQTIVAEDVVGVGFIVTGIGLFLVVLTMINIFARREQESLPQSVSPPEIWGGPATPPPPAWMPPPPPQ